MIPRTTERRVAFPRPVLRGQNCQCMACGLCFRAVSTFDLHRVGPYTDRRCLADMELSGKGWGEDSSGFWRRPGRAPAPDPTWVSFSNGPVAEYE